MPPPICRAGLRPAQRPYRTTHADPFLARSARGRGWARRASRRGDLVLGQLERLGGQRILEMLLLGGADDRRRDTGLGEQPGQGDLRRRHVAGGGDLHDGVDDVEVRRLVVEVVGEGVGARAGRESPTRSPRPVPGQHPTHQGAPRDAPHTLVEAERNHLALLHAVDQVVVVLHGDEPGPAVHVGGVLRLGELPRGHAAGTDVARLAGPYDVVQRLHRLLNGRAGIPAVDLIEVHVLHLEVLERGVDARRGWFCDRGRRRFHPGRPA